MASRLRNFRKIGTGYFNVMAGGARSRTAESSSVPSASGTGCIPFTAHSNRVPPHTSFRVWKAGVSKLLEPASTGLPVVTENHVVKAFSICSRMWISSGSALQYSQNMLLLSCCCNKPILSSAVCPPP